MPFTTPTPAENETRWGEVFFGPPINEGCAPMFGAKKTKAVRSDFGFHVSRHVACGTVARMLSEATRIAQPGRTGTREAPLRTVKAARRSLSAGPVTVVMRDVMRTAIRELEPSSREVVERCGDLSSGSSSARKGATSRSLAPVSVEPCTIETGAAILAQRQSPWASRQFSVDAKVQKSASSAATSRTMSPPASDPRSMQRRSSRDVR